LTSIRKLLLLASLVLAAPLALIACGGDEDTGEDPQEVIDQTLNNDQTITSGTMSISVDGSAEGEQGGSFGVDLSGPFQGAEGDPTAFPQFDFTADVSAEGAGQSFSFEGGLIVTEDNAFVEYQGETYEVGTETFQQFMRAYQRQAAQTQAQQQEGQSFGEAFTAQCEAAVQQGGGDPSACDIDFSSWLTNLDNEGTEDIEGTESVHVHGDLDVDQMLQDLAELGQATQGAGVAPVPDLEGQIEMISGAVSEASFDLYSTEAESLLNGLDFNLGIDPSAIEGAEEAGVDSVDVGFSIRIGAINEPQTIEGPADARPLDELLGQFGIPGLEGLGGLGGLGGPTIPGAPGGGAPPGGDAYLDCIAQNPNNPEQCLDELQ
jgi:hypothetical protein